MTAALEPEDLRRANEARARLLTADDTLTYRLAWRSAYLPEEVALLLDRIESIRAAAGQQALLETASLARSELDARLLLNAVGMLLEDAQDSSGRVESLQGGEFVVLGRWVAYHRPDGELLLPLAVDRLSWTKDAASWFDQHTIVHASKRTLMVTGSISPTAERALTTRGWSLRQHARWSKAPPYRQPGDAA